jgi:hypothetical protein
MIGQMVINEVSGTGTGNACSNGINFVDNVGWVEIRNIGQSTVDFSGYSLFRPGSRSETLLGRTFTANAIQIYCYLSFRFGTGDTIFLRDPGGKEISTTGPIPAGTSTSKTFSRDDSGVYRIAPATPKFQNVFDETKV